MGVIKTEKQVGIIVIMGDMTRGIMKSIRLQNKDDSEPDKQRRSPGYTKPYRYTKRSYYNHLDRCECDGKIQYIDMACPPCEQDVKQKEEERNKIEEARRKEAAKKEAAKKIEVTLEEVINGSTIEIESANEKMIVFFYGIAGKEEYLDNAVTLLKSLFLGRKLYVVKYYQHSRHHIDGLVFADEMNISEILVKKGYATVSQTCLEDFCEKWRSYEQSGVSDRGTTIDVSRDVALSQP